MIIEVVGAVIRDEAGRLLTVRKRGTTRFMLPGGKPEPGENDATALARESNEELGIKLVSAQLLGRFEAPAANEPGATVISSAYLVQSSGEAHVRAEIEAMLWIDPTALPGIPIAPLLTAQILPALNQAEKPPTDA